MAGMEVLKYPGCYYCDNIIDSPTEIGLLYLGFPRVFIIVRDMEGFVFSDYGHFREAIADIQWLDPSDIGNYTEEEKEAVIIKLWNFTVEAEEREEQIAIENEERELLGEDPLGLPYMD